MYDVGSDKEGNSKFGLLHGDALQFEDLTGSLDIEDASYFLAAYHLLKLVGHHMTGYHVASGDKIHLAEFLLKSHAPHKLVDKGVHPAVGIVTAMTA